MLARGICHCSRRAFDLVGWSQATLLEFAAVLCNSGEYRCLSFANRVVFLQTWAFLLVICLLPCVLACLAVDLQGSSIISSTTILAALQHPTTNVR